MADIQQQSDAVKRIGDISSKIREAIRQALPTPQEQFMTVMVPGKVVNFDDYEFPPESETLPRSVELNQAILCDDMPTLSPIQLGPTGRSVARSYVNAISKLVSHENTIGLDAAEKKTNDQKRYEEAMQKLSASVVNNGKKTTLIELYTEKQTRYTQVVAEKTKAFRQAREDAQQVYTNPKDVRVAYEKWVEEHARTYRNYVQAAYMDWVVTGKKEEVEFYFAVVDQDTAMARVEQSKENMRSAVIQDVDGSCEYQKVKLEPSNWASLCKNKIARGANQTKTAEWYTFEIDRLEQMNTLLTQLQKSPPKFTEGQKQDLTKLKANLDDKMNKYLSDRQAYLNIPAPAPLKKDSSDADKQAFTTANAAREMAFKEAESSKGGLAAAEAEYQAGKVQNMTEEHKSSHNGALQKMTEDGGYIGNQIQANKSAIDRLTADRTKCQGSEADAPETYLDQLAEDTGVPRPAKEKSESMEADYFTPIMVEISASSSSETTSTSATSASIGVSASWGMGSVSADVSHSQAHSDATAELANSSVKISLEVMRVDMSRTWLRSELFYDHDLVPGPKVKISPGFYKLRGLMEGNLPGISDTERQKELDDYSLFPMYPTAFLVACNVILEITGSTSKLQSYMHSSGTSASASVTYGCFSFSGSGAHSKSDTGSTCKSTASGCRIEIKSPQIIGWVSQMVPALPRLPVVPMGSTGDIKNKL